MRPIIVKLARMLTDCMDVKLGLVRMDESRWEYKMLDALLTDEMAGLMLTMGRRKPTTAAELAQKTGREETRIQKLLDELSEIGLVEYNRRSSDRHKQYVVPIFVVGSAENLVLNKPLLEKHPEIAEFFYQMARDPRSFRAFRRDNAAIPADRLGGHNCLSCGVSYVDPNRCIGCGICTTRCLFGAIRLERSHPEFADYCSADDTVKRVVLGGVRRAGRIAIKSIGKKTDA